MKLLLTISIVLLHFSYVVAQHHTTDSITSNDYDQKLIDSLLFEMVNTERLNRSLPKLFKSERLQSAAEIHVSEIQKKKKIYYSDNQSGECIQANAMGLPVTYQTLAKKILEKWLQSPGHEKLIMGEFFLYGGCSVRIEKVKNQLQFYAVIQVSYND